MKKTLFVSALASATLLISSCSGGTTTDPDKTAGGSANSAAASADGKNIELKCPEGELSGGGASSQKLAIDSLGSAYKQKCKEKSKVEYTSTGSGAGIKDFYNAQIDWAGSDSPLKDKEKNGIIQTEKAKARCKGNPAWNLPLVISPVAFAFNLGKGFDDLTLSPKIISKIAFGKITKWNDPEIKALNEKLDLPDLKISVFFRSDESGTTENVTKYLKTAASADFPAEHSKKWPGTVGEGKKGTQGVANGVKGARGGFGYMEWKYAKDSNLGYVKLDNGKGGVKLTPESVATAVGEAKIKGEGNDIRLEVKYAGTSDKAYAMVMPTYEIVCSKGLDPKKTESLKDFLGFLAQKQTQERMVDLGYGPLPEELRTKVVKAIETIS